MAVERVHKEYNKETNYGAHPSMAKFARVFAKMEQMRQDKCIRYEYLIAQGKPLDKPNRSSDGITEALIVCRDSFVQQTVDARDYDPIIAVKYLQDVYRVSYPQKVIDAWKRAGPKGLQWV